MPCAGFLIREKRAYDCDLLSSKFYLPLIISDIVQDRWSGAV